MKRFTDQCICRHLNRNNIGERQLLELRLFNIPTNLDHMQNYSFCELIDLGVEIDDDWYNMGNINCDALDDLQVEFPYILRTPSWVS